MSEWRIYWSLKERGCGGSALHDLVNTLKVDAYRIERDWSCCCCCHQERQSSFFLPLLGARTFSVSLTRDGGREESQKKKKTKKRREIKWPFPHIDSP
jgi:hypothetical protein